HSRWRLPLLDRGHIECLGDDISLDDDVDAQPERLRRARVSSGGIEAILEGLGLELGGRGRSRERSEAQGPQETERSQAERGPGETRFHAFLLFSTASRPITRRAGGSAGLDQAARITRPAPDTSPGSGRRPSWMIGWPFTNDHRMPLARAMYRGP